MTFLMFLGAGAEFAALCAWDVWWQRRRAKNDDHGEHTGGTPPGS